MWIPLHSTQINTPAINHRTPVSDGWYIWHPRLGIRCNRYTLAPWATREDAQEAANKREQAINLAEQVFFDAQTDYRA